MFNTFCTLFDSAYMARGLVMYESLMKYMPEANLYIFAFDELCFQLLNKLNLKNTVIISQEQFETEDLLNIKKQRTKVEYCWTCTPFVTKYILEKYNLPCCTYLDADIYFYNSPDQLFEEMQEQSILITPHRYTREYDQTTTSGKYCVQFTTFLNDTRGVKALDWWSEACLRWCHAYCEDGKFGDQKYLDDWPDRFEGVQVLRHLGGGVAPWNVQQYQLIKENNKIFGVSINDKKQFPLVFYHFHGLKYLTHNKVDISNYRISNNVKDLLYTPYIEHLNKVMVRLHCIEKNLNVHDSLPSEGFWRTLYRQFRRRLTHTYNIVKVE